MVRQPCPAGGWAPQLIGVGDLPLAGIAGIGNVPQARCLDALLNSGLLLGNDRAIQGYRAVATTDITSANGTSGRAVELDRRLAQANVSAGQPSPAVRMATALFNYSLVGRTQGRRGAGRPHARRARGHIGNPSARVCRWRTSAVPVPGPGRAWRHRSTVRASPP